MRVCVSGGKTPEGVCMSVSPEEAPSIPSGEGVEGLKEPVRPGGLAGGASTTAQDSVKATTGGDVPSLSVSFSDDCDSPPSESLSVDESEPSLSEFEFSQLTFTIQLKQTGTVKIFTASDFWDLVRGVHCECAHAGVKEVMAQLLFHFSFELPLTTIRACVARVLSSCPECPQVKGPVGFSIPGVSFTKGAYVGARLHLDSLYLGASDCGPTHQLTVLEDFLPYGLAPRFAAHPNSHETVAFLENVWFPRFGVPEEIRCDQGSEFANAPLIELSKRRGFRLSFAPSGYKDGNSLSERWQREVLASVRSLLLERQLPGSSWPEIHDEAIRRLNNRMSVQGGGSRHTAAAFPSSLSCVQRSFPSARPPRPSALWIYCVGDIVMYNRGASGGGGRSGQGHKCGPVWAPYRLSPLKTNTSMKS
uniref:Integrase catalytic domain-containing protein n=1 Tax=Chromera velia CCMP2878 TaxID=1169474 RepID=A0A0G4HPV5_9ALVE|eukprot:Cvel_7816.t1-p1 / transcript=Cvel_7816.t1 / gene=Cvel_7816 / organism=Chromera_velia_CCMP2878 / gene_product=hypothetical protein / transcript_product=hypothetical protein / location=Cvel_scaffold417:47025-48278(-) / protein_length=418 / sequence_SO=supercontig / SO=protein_coding / is_pseudo=false